MTQSIRRFLLVYILLSVSLIIALIVTGNHYLDNRDIDSRLDSWLSQTTLVIQALLGSDLEVRQLDSLEKEIKKIPLQGKYFFSLRTKHKSHMHYHDRFQFQVWNEDGKLLLHSSGAPVEPLSDGNTGLNERYIDGVPWRVFTTYNPKTGLIISAAERHDMRKELRKRIAYDNIFIIFLAYPLLGVAIWTIIGYGLNSLARVASEVAYRVPSYLEPVDLREVPEEIRPLVDELNKLFMRLQDALDREKRFASDAAHELRTPLAALRTQAEVALNARNKEERDTALSKLINGVDRCTHVVQQLLTLSRLAPHKTIQENECQQFNIVSVVTETIAEAVPAALKKQIDIELDCKEEIINMHGNPTAIGILMRNLIDNAIRYTPIGGTVDISVELDNRQIIFKVRDNGPGIPAHLRARVFERFYRVLGTKEVGSGLGLPIVQQIATLHQGHIALGTPKSGSGLEVTVTFPRQIRFM